MKTKTNQAKRWLVGCGVALQLLTLGAGVARAQTSGCVDPATGGSCESGGTGTSTTTSEPEHDDHDSALDLDHGDDFCIDPQVVGKEDVSSLRPPPGTFLHNAELAQGLAEVVALGDFPSLIFHREPYLDHRWIRIAERPDTTKVGTLKDGRQFVDTALGDLPVRLCTGGPTSLDAIEGPEGAVWLYSGKTALAGLELQKVYSVGPDPATGMERAVLGKLALARPDGSALDSMPTDWLSPKQQAAMEGATACEIEALEAVPDLPQHMPPVHFPTMILHDCNRDDACFLLKRTWLLAHHHAWRTYQMVDYMAEHPHSAGFLWDREGLGPLGEFPITAYRASDWFGSNFAAHRFDVVRKVVDELWHGRINGHKVNGWNLQLMCPDPANVGDLCFAFTPSAHHAVEAQIAICDKGFDKYEHTPNGFARLLLHELGHHLWFWWQPNGNYWWKKVLKDQHTHGHGSNCKSDKSSEQMDTEDKAWHLGNYSYDGVDSHDCDHRDIAVRNADSYARWMMELGYSVYSGQLARWPQPPPQPNNGACDQYPGMGGGYGPDNDNPACDGPKGENMCGGLPEGWGALEGGAVLDTDCILAPNP
jgi:hypothetical protein